MQFWVPELVFCFFFFNGVQYLTPILSLCGIPLIYMIDWMCFIVIYRFMLASSLYIVLVLLQSSMIFHSQSLGDMSHDRTGQRLIGCV